jgi:2-dehydro-3-deoxyphosphogluconate aldolase/(4S)-4-hydroxy-2-oxoglutarate aldolase
MVDGGAVAVIRMANAQKLIKVVDAVRKGGISAIEITMTTPNALEVIEEVATTMSDTVRIGVGSVLDGETTRLAINAGAQYVVSPIFKESIVEMAHRYDKPVMPGAFNPTQIQRAHESGADIIKVFPASTLGMKYFKAVKAPMPHLKLMPTGGVSLDNAGDWIRHGACAVAVGSALLDKEAIAAGNFDQLTENARRLRASIEEGRGS